MYSDKHIPLPYQFGGDEEESITERVESKLKRQGYITRNEICQMGTRYPAQEIQLLRKRGMKIKTARKGRKSTRYVISPPKS